MGSFTIAIGIFSTTSSISCLWVPGTWPVPVYAHNLEDIAADELVYPIGDPARVLGPGETCCEHPLRRRRRPRLPWTDKQHHRPAFSAA